MKKTIMSLILCFAAVNAFAMTAEEILEKALLNNAFHDLQKINSYITGYSVKSRLDESREMQYKVIVDGVNKRMDIEIKSKDALKYFSVIINGASGYVSSTRDEGGKFIDYQVLKSTKDISSLDDFAYFMEKVEDAEIVFNEKAKKEKNEFVIDVMAKGREEILVYHLNKRATNAKTTKQEDAELDRVMRYQRFWIDKDKMTINKYYQDGGKDFLIRRQESNAERPLTDEERQVFFDSYPIVGNCSIKYSEYNKIAGSERKFAVNAGTYMETGVTKEPMDIEFVFKSFKIIEDGKVDKSEFVPSNIKKGKIKSSKELQYVIPSLKAVSALFRSSGNAGGVTKEEVEVVLEDVDDTSDESDQDAGKEVGKEVGKQAAKEGAKSVTKGILKGLGGF